MTTHPNRGPLAPIADQVAKDLYQAAGFPSADPDMDYYAIRDAADLATGGEFPTRKLDRLSDMIEARLRNPRRYNLVPPTGYI